MLPNPASYGLSTIRSGIVWKSARLIRVDGLCAPSRKNARRFERALLFGPSLLAKAGQAVTEAFLCDQILQPRLARLS
jgi:hypothetical protein